MQAVVASFGSFEVGALLPFWMSLLASLKKWYVSMLISIIFLMFLWAISARSGGFSIKLAVLRIWLWGTVVMGITALVGKLYGVNVT